MKSLFLLFAILNATTIWAGYSHEAGEHSISRTTTSSENHQIRVDNSESNLPPAYDNSGNFAQVNPMATGPTRAQAFQAAEGFRDQAGLSALRTLMVQRGVGGSPAEREAAIQRAQQLNGNQIMKIMRGINPRTRKAIYVGIGSAVLIIMLATVIAILKNPPTNNYNY